MPLDRAIPVYGLFVLPSRENTLQLVNEVAALSSHRPDVALPLRDVSFAEEKIVDRQIEGERTGKTYVNRSRIERALFSSGFVGVFPAVVDERRTRITVLLAIQRITVRMRSFDR